MIPSIGKIMARRSWFVPGFSVWGLPSLGEYDLLTRQEIDGAWSLYYGSVSIGESDQEVLYSQLTDHRGNTLPSSMKSPRVFPRAKSGDPVFVVGTEASDRFKIAREPQATGPVIVDLMVVEMGD